MRILKHGAPRIGIFGCGRCGCRWQATPDEYIKPDRGVENFTEKDDVFMECPECGLMVLGKIDDCFIICYSCKHWTGEAPYIGNQERFCEFIDAFDEKAPDFVSMHRPPEETEVVSCKKYECLR